MSIRGNLHPSSPNELLVQSLNEAIDQINRLQRTQTLRDQAGVQRYLVGYQKDGWGTGKDFGFKISKPGIDVLSATDEQLILKDDFATRIYYDDDNSRIVLGLLPDGGYGLAISKEGQDVEDAFS